MGAVLLSCISLNDAEQLHACFGAASVHYFALQSEESSRHPPFVCRWSPRGATRQLLFCLLGWHYSCSSGSIISQKLYWTCWDRANFQSVWRKASSDTYKIPSVHCLLMDCRWIKMNYRYFCTGQTGCTSSLQTSARVKKHVMHEVILEWTLEY